MLIFFGRKFFMRIINSIRNLSRFEGCLWIFSLLVIAVSFMITKDRNYLMLFNSLIGVTSLIFAAKADVLGPVLMVAFSIIYGIISLSFRYYGEMLTYLLMTLPMSVMSVISWLKHPSSQNKSEVEVNYIKHKEVGLMALAAIAVTIVFYFILKAFGTNSLMLSTVSVTTSFFAEYLAFRRSQFYALAYAANDLVLIFLWIIATLANSVYLPVAICFVMFFVNDIYGFINWNKISKRQN